MITYTQGSQELLDHVAPLWKKLTIHHAGISTYFSDQFKNMAWTDRKAGLIDKGHNGRLFVVLAGDDQTNLFVGYCVATVDLHNVAEVDSLFIDEDCRSSGIGTELVRRTLMWIESEKPASTMVNVAVGNESAFGFYRQFGFYPRVTTLVRKQ
jgi:diamine N-acetyltransferase